MYVFKKKKKVTLLTRNLIYPKFLYDPIAQCPQFTWGMF